MCVRVEKVPRLILKGAKPITVVLVSAPCTKNTLACASCVGNPAGWKRSTDFSRFRRLEGLGQFRRRLATRIMPKQRRRGRRPSPVLTATVTKEHRRRSSKYATMDRSFVVPIFGVGDTRCVKGLGRSGFFSQKAEIDPSLPFPATASLRTAAARLRWRKHAASLMAARFVSTLCASTAWRRVG